MSLSLSLLWRTGVGGGYNRSCAEDARWFQVSQTRHVPRVAQDSHWYGLYRYHDVVKPISLPGDCSQGGVTQNRVLLVVLQSPVFIPIAGKIQKNILRAEIKAARASDDGP